MDKMCNHEFNIRFSVFHWIKINCVNCGAYFCIIKKYSCMCYCLGLFGWIPCFILS